MIDKSKTPQLDNHNSWLIRKRQKLIGDHDFAPASYLHLAHFWGYISNKELKIGKKYAKLRGLLDQAQGNYVVWNHKLCLNRHSRASLSYDWDFAALQHRLKIYTGILKKL